LILEAKQEMDDLRSSLAQVEADLDKAVKTNHDLERKSHLSEDKHRQTVEEYRDEMLTTKLQCEDKLKNQYREREKYETQVRLVKRENDLIKESMRQNEIKVIDMTKTIKGLEKRLAAEKANGMVKDSKLAKLEDRMAAVTSIHDNLTQSLEELEKAINDLTTVGSEFQTTVKLRDNAILELTEKNRELSLQVFQLKVELRKSCEEGNVDKEKGNTDDDVTSDAKVNDDEVSSSRERLKLLEAEKAYFEDRVTSLGCDLESTKAQLALADKTLENCRELGDLWDQTVASIEASLKANKYDASDAAATSTSTRLLLEEVLTHLRTVGMSDVACEGSPSRCSGQPEGS